MPTEPAVTLEVALIFLALALLIVIWVFARLASEYREINRRRQAVRDRLSSEEAIEWDGLQEVLGVLRDRARGWSTDHYVDARRTIEAIDEYEARAVEDPATLAQKRVHARSVLAEFDEEPDGARLHIIGDKLGRG